jgi:hypothetical protein
MKAFDEIGHLLDAEFDIERDGDDVFMVFHARYGTRGSGSEVNIDYLQALEIVLARLATLDAVIIAIEVDSRVARALPRSERLLPLSYPIRLGPTTDKGRLRRDITEAQRKVAQKPDAKAAGGNNHKRIRAAIAFPPQTDLNAVRRSLVGGAAHANSEGARKHVLSPTLTPFPPYRMAAPDTSITQRSVGSVLDAELIERALAGHARVQNALAEFVRTQGLVPVSPSTSGPDFDLGWVGIEFTVAEIKSLSGGNVERQLRLGLGQVIQYRTMLRRSGVVAQAVLAVERPVDRFWVEVCSSAGVILTWPDDWPRLEPVMRSA